MFVLKWAVTHFGVRIESTCLGADILAAACLVLQPHGGGMGPQKLPAPMLFMLQLLDNNSIASLPDALTLLSSRLLFLKRCLPQWVATL